MKKVNVEQKKVGIYEGCLILKTKRGHLTDTDIAETLDKTRIAENAYLQIHITPDGEFDPRLYDEGDLVVLYPIDQWLGLGASRLAERIVTGDKCPICCTEGIQPEWSFCPCCGQALKRVEKKEEQK